MIWKQRTEEIENYLFIDLCRLNVYLDQIKKTGHIGNFSIELVLPAIIQLILKGERLLNEPNAHQKINTLKNYLQKTNQLDHMRVWNPKNGKLFYLETCDARRIRFLNAKSMIPGVNELAIWIAPRPQKDKDRIGPLYLIEYYPQDLPQDNADHFPYSPSNNMSGMSGYTAYRYLLEMLDDETKIVLNSCLSLAPEEDPEVSFAKDPFKCWNTSKLTISDMRRIKCLYLRRAVVFENNGPIPSTFGYPIYISSA
jgi:hypothetical protein